jgi:acyl dehydratase
VPLNTDLVGKEYPESTYEVTAEAIEKYARATNDDNERYLSGENVVASPIFPIVPAFRYLMEAGMDPELQADLLRLVHGEEEHVLHKPIKAGDVLTIHPVIESIERKDTGETFTIKVSETDRQGDLVAEVRATSFIRGTGSGKRAAASPTSEPEERQMVHEDTTKVDEDQTYRYAEASGDQNPIHLDENTARMAGLPGIILHGMCTMAIATKGAVNGLAGGDPTRVKRVAVRFSRPVLPGQELTTKFWKTGFGDGVTVYGFETYNPDGRAVIKNASVEIADA